MFFLKKASSYSLANTKEQLNFSSDKFAHFISLSTLQLLRGLISVSTVQPAIWVSSSNKELKFNALTYISISLVSKELSFIADNKNPPAI